MQAAALSLDAVHWARLLVVGAFDGSPWLNK